jgi:hypothetical protein
LEEPPSTIASVSKRALAAFLWFSATWVGYEIVWSLTGVPRMAGPVIAFTVAALVTIDPMALFWPRTASDSPTGRALGSTAVAPH